MMISIEELMKVRDDAFCALNEQVVGAEFVGAFGEADKAGYQKDTVEFNVFCAIFAGALKDVWIDKVSGLIAKVELY